MQYNALWFGWLVLTMCFWATNVPKAIQCVVVWMVGIDIVFFVTKIAKAIQCAVFWMVGIDNVFFGYKDCKVNTMRC